MRAVKAHEKALEEKYCAIEPTNISDQGQESIRWSFVLVALVWELESDLSYSPVLITISNLSHFLEREKLLWFFLSRKEASLIAIVIKLTYWEIKGFHFSHLKPSTARAFLHRWVNILHVNLDTHVNKWVHVWAFFEVVVDF